MPVLARPRSALALTALPAAVLVLAGTVGGSAAAQELPLPARPADAPGGRAVAAAVRDLEPEAREARLAEEILRGNVPSWLRPFRPVELVRARGEETRTVRIAVAPDYLAVGSDLDWFLVPLTPGTAQRIADATATELPTTVIVDAIWEQADIRLGPDSLPPGPEMTTVPWFERHDALVRARRIRAGVPLGALVSGHKKDVVLTPRLDERPGHVAIYGWHRPNGDPIQPLYTGHTDDWADYSHGIRLISREVLVDGERHDLIDLLLDPDRWWLLEEEGPLRSGGGDPPREAERRPDGG